MLQKTSHFMRQANLIGGEWVQADSGATIDVTNPATGLKIGTVPKSGKSRDAPRHRGCRGGFPFVEEDLGARSPQAVAQAA